MRRPAHPPVQPCSSKPRNSPLRIYSGNRRRRSSIPSVPSPGKHLIAANSYSGISYFGAKTEIARQCCWSLPGREEAKPLCVFCQATAEACGNQAGHQADEGPEEGAPHGHVRRFQGTGARCWQTVRTGRCCRSWLRRLHSGEKARWCHVWH